MNDPRFVSYAQNLEDVMLWRALGEVVGSEGFYIDVGASDPTFLSITRAFSDRGWRGLNVEPLPAEAAQLRAARPRDVVVEAAVADMPGTLPFHRIAHGSMTGCSTLRLDDPGPYLASGGAIETFEVPVTTLAALCLEHVTGPVHFLKIDVEGGEAAVLAGADFRTVRPWIVLVEATLPMTQIACEAEWESGLLAAGYRFVWFDGLNRFYLAEEHAELARHFVLPPNVFDNYVQYDPILRAALHATEALAEARLALLQAREAMPEPKPAPRPEPVRALPASRRGLSSLGWRALRPFARPLAWRLRHFLLLELREELAALHRKQDLTMHALGRLQGLSKPDSSR